MLITNGFDQNQGKDFQFGWSIQFGACRLLPQQSQSVFLWKVLSELTAKMYNLSRIWKSSWLIGVQRSETEFETFTVSACYLPWLCEPYRSGTVSMQAQLLLLVEMNRPETKAILPGKLFEYLRSRRPILAIGPQGSDMKASLRKHRQGILRIWQLPSSKKDLLLQYYHQYQQTGIATVSGEIEAYSRKAVTQQMAELIKSL